MNGKHTEEILTESDGPGQGFDNGISNTGKEHICLLLTMCGNTVPLSGSYRDSCQSVSRICRMLTLSGQAVPLEDWFRKKTGRF